MSIECVGGSIIILGANFGRTTTEYCTVGEIYNTNCTTLASTTVVSGLYVVNQLHVKNL